MRPQAAGVQACSFNDSRFSTAPCKPRHRASQTQRRSSPARPVVVAPSARLSKRKRTGQGLNEGPTSVTAHFRRLTDHALDPSACSDKQLLISNEAASDSTLIVARRLRIVCVDASQAAMLTRSCRQSTPCAADMQLSTCPGLQISPRPRRYEPKICRPSSQPFASVSALCLSLQWPARSYCRPWLSATQCAEPRSQCAVEAGTH